MCWSRSIHISEFPEHLNDLLVWWVSVCILINVYLYWIVLDYSYKYNYVYIVQLLHKLSIRAVNGNEKLLRVIENPVEKYLPTNCHKIGKLFSIFSFFVFGLVSEVIVLNYLIWGFSTFVGCTISSIIRICTNNSRRQEYCSCGGCYGTWYWWLCGFLCWWQD